MPGRAKKNKNKTDKSKQVVIFDSHFNIDGRPLFKQFKLVYYDTEIETNHLDISRLIQNICDYVGVYINGTGVLDIFCNHPSVGNYMEIGHYDEYLQQLVIEKITFIIEKQKKSKKKNESLLYDVILKKENKNQAQFTCDINFNFYSRPSWDTILNNYNSWRTTKNVKANRKKKKKQHYNMMNNDNIDNTDNTDNTDNIDNIDNIDHGDRDDNNIDENDTNTSFWRCNRCTFKENKAEWLRCDVCNNCKPFIAERRPKKKPNKNTYNFVENIDDLMGSDADSNDDDDDDDDLKITHNKTREKRTASNIISGPQKRKKLDDNKCMNNNNNMMNNNGKTLENIQSKNPWLTKGDYSCKYMEDVRILYHRMVALKLIDNKLGCEPIGKLSGIGTSTTCKNYQKLYISILDKNKERAQQNLPPNTIQAGLNVTSICIWLKDNYQCNNIQEMIKNVTKPGEQWPTSADTFIDENDLKIQREIMEKRYKTWKAWKSVKKAIPKK